MKKGIFIPKPIINKINDDYKSGLSIRNIAKKYSYDKSKISRVIRGENNGNYENYYYSDRLNNNKIYDVNNYSLIRKYLKKHYDVNIGNITISNFFNIVQYDSELIKFEVFLNSIRNKYTINKISNGLTKYEFNNINIYHVNINKINSDLVNKSSFLKNEKDLNPNSLFFYSDEWINKRNIVEAKILYVFNKSKSKPIYARKTKICEINDLKIVNNFLDKNHIQGSVPSASFTIAAYYNDKLISVMLFHKNKIYNTYDDYDLELTRYATDINFRGVGLGSKMISYFTKKYTNINRILSYGDKRFVLSDSKNLYDSIGFKEINKNSRNTSYFLKKENDDTRYHNYGKKKFIDNNIKFEKIWDCGKYKYMLEINR